jgi:hypothetical protein
MLMESPVRTSGSILTSLSRFETHNSSPSTDRSRSFRAGLPLVLALVAPVAWFAVVSWLRPSPIADEVLHQKVIADLTRGVWPRPGYLTVLPALHVIAAGLTFPWGGSLAASRAVIVVFSVGMVALAWALLRRNSGSPAAVLLIGCNPLILPFTALVYTDVPAMGILLSALCAVIAGRWWLSGVAMCAACLVRQSSVVWLALLALFALGTPATSREKAARLVPLGVALAFFVVVYALAREQIVSSQLSNQPGFNPAQLYVFAVCIAVGWAPLWIEELARMWAGLLSPVLMRGWGAAAILAAIAVLWLLFSNPHPWNADADYLRNRLLVAMQLSPAIRTGVCATIVLAAIAAVHFTVRQPNARELAAVWGVSLLFLAPHSMVEPRYYVVPIALLHVTMRYTPGAASRLAAWNVAITVGFCGYLTSSETAAIW